MFRVEYRTKLTGREWERSTEKETESGHCSLLRRFRILFKTWETERERETKREKEREREREREKIGRAHV